MAKRETDTEFQARLRERAGLGNAGGMVLNPLPQHKPVSLESMLETSSATTSVNTPVPATEHGNIEIYVPLDRIVSNPKYQTRTNLDEGHVEDIRRSFHSSGQREPIPVRRVGDKYEHLGGHHRLEAARRESWDKILVRVLVLSDFDALKFALLHNSGHKDETDYERARLFQLMLDEKIVRTQVEIADISGLSKGRVSQIMEILKLPTPVLDLVHQYPQLLNSRTIKPVRELCDAHPEHLDKVLEALTRIIDGHDESSVKPWVLQSIQALQKQKEGPALQPPRVISNKRGVAMFEVAAKGNRITIALTANKDQIERVECLVYEALLADAIDQDS